MLEFEIITQGLYRPDQLTIQYDASMHISPSSQAQTWMDTFWDEQLRQAAARKTRLFDAPLFRYINARPGPDQSLHLTLGDTSYKEYVTTRSPIFARKRVREELANPLAVCSVIETSDGHILLDQRQGVDVYAGRYHVIGGFFERSLDTTSLEAVSASVRPDPFVAMRREIREETGIRENDIRAQYCLGVVYDITTPHAEMCFLTLLHIPLQEVLQRRPEDDEIKQLIPLYVTGESLRTFILKNHGNISATGEPNLLFYGSWKFGTAWFDEIIALLK